MSTPYSPPKHKIAIQAEKDSKQIKVINSTETKETGTISPEDYLYTIDELQEIIRQTVSDKFNPKNARTIATTIYIRGKDVEYKDDENIVIELAAWLKALEEEGYYKVQHPIAFSMSIDGIGYAAQNGRVTQSADIAIDLANYLKNVEHRAIHFSTAILGLGNIANAEITREVVLFSQSVDIAIDLAIILNECNDLLPINCGIAVLGLGRLAEADKLSKSADIAIVLASKIISNPRAFNALDLSTTILGLAKLAMAGKLTKTVDIAIDLASRLIASRNIRKIDLANAIYGLGVLIAANKISSSKVSTAKTLISQMLKMHQSITDASRSDYEIGSQIVVGLGFAGLPIPDAVINNLRQPETSSLHIEVSDLLGKQYHLNPQNEAFIQGFYCDIVFNKTIFEIDGVVHTKKRHQNFAQLRDSILERAGYNVKRININDFSNNPRRIAEYIAKVVENQKSKSGLISSSSSALSTSSASASLSPSLPLSTIEERERKAKEEKDRKEKGELERKKKKHEKRVNQKAKQQEREILHELIAAAIKGYGTNCCRKPSIPKNIKDNVVESIINRNILSVPQLRNSPEEITKCIQNAITKDPSISHCNFWSNQYIIDIPTLNRNLQNIISEQKEATSTLES